MLLYARRRDDRIRWAVFADLPAAHRGDLFWDCHLHFADSRAPNPAQQSNKWLVEKALVDSNRNWNRSFHRDVLFLASLFSSEGDGSRTGYDGRLIESSVVYFWVVAHTFCGTTLLPPVSATQTSHEMIVAEQRHAGDCGS